MSQNKRGKVWLGAAGLVMNRSGEWLVVRKTYGGLKGLWSLPAGFVDEDETIDEAAVREVREETGIECNLVGMIGFRTGVLSTGVSDNLGLFLLEPNDENQPFSKSAREIAEVAWIHPSKLVEDPDATKMIHELAEEVVESTNYKMSELNPGDWFGYKTYKLFFQK